MASGSGFRSSLRQGQRNRSPAALARAVSCRAFVERRSRRMGFSTSSMTQSGRSRFRIVCSAEATAISRADGLWRVRAGDAEYNAPVLVNAAGAWADQVATLAGAPTIGLVAKRRSAFTFPLHRPDAGLWPFVTSTEADWYIQPQRHGFMASRVDADPQPPGEAWADDMRIAEAIHNIARDTEIEVRRPTATWGGLRSFVADNNPVCGGFPDVPGYYVSAGQGGCGVLTSPAMGQAIAAIVDGHTLPDALGRFGVTETRLSPRRCVRR